MTTPTLVEAITKEIQIDEQGKATVSVRAAARIVGVKHPTLVRQFQGGTLESSKLAQKLIERGFEGGTLNAFSETGIPDIALSIIIQYYAMDAGRYCTEQAKAIMSAFIAIGLRTWLQQQVEWHPPVNVETQLADIKKSLTAIESQLTTKQFTLPEVQPLTTKRATLAAATIAHPNPEIAEIPMRRKIILLINDFCYAYDRNYRSVYQYIYTQYKERYGYNVYQQSAENADNKKDNKLDQIEADGEMERFWQMTTILLATGN